LDRLLLHGVIRGCVPLTGDAQLGIRIFCTFSADSSQDFRRPGFPGGFFQGCLPTFRQLLDNVCLKRRSAAYAFRRSASRTRGIEHDMQMIADMADRIHVLDYRRTIAHGAPAAVLADRSAMAAYLGVQP
jgi:hypothetical protein